jgi:hypothetical protein
VLVSQKICNMGTLVACLPAHPKVCYLGHQCHCRLSCRPCCCPAAAAAAHPVAAGSPQHPASSCPQRPAVDWHTHAVCKL